MTVLIEFCQILDHPSFKQSNKQQLPQILRFQFAVIDIFIFKESEILSTYRIRCCYPNPFSAKDVMSHEKQDKKSFFANLWCTLWCGRRPRRHFYFIELSP